MDADGRHDPQAALDPRASLDPRLAWRAAQPADRDALIARTAAVERPVWFERAEDLAQILESRNNAVTLNSILGGFVVNDPLARPDLSGVVVERSSGDVAGYQLDSHDAGAAAERGFKEGYTDLFGVRPRFRGRRSAKALLADAMRRFAAAGMDKASLDVDAENPTGAMALYTKMGYAPVNRSMAWAKEL